MNMHTFVGLLLSLVLVALGAIALHPRGKAAAADPRGVAAPEETPKVAESFDRGPRAAPGPTASAAPIEASASPSVRAPLSSFTEVRDGETLAAVAERVYGTREERERLWRANRDLLSGPDATLASGTILRTP